MNELGLKRYFLKKIGEKRQLRAAIEKLNAPKAKPTTELKEKGNEQQAISAFDDTAGRTACGISHAKTQAAPSRHLSRNL